MEHYQIKGDDGIEINLIPTEDGTGTLALVYAPTETAIQKVIMDLADHYAFVEFTRAKFHDSRWHATGVIRD